MQQEFHQKNNTNRPQTARSRRFRRMWAYALAGMLAIGIVGAVTLLYRRTAAPVNNHLLISGASYTTHQGKPGQRRELQLPDGSKAILNSLSTLMVPQGFGQQTRELVLDGEAFFDVKPGSQPFVVKTDKLTATVLGTAFKIRSFTSQQGATLYLLNGKVKVAKTYHSPTDNQPEILERGQMVLANSEIDLMEKETYDPAELETWLQGRLSFQRESLMATVRKLEEWYGVEVDMQGNITNITEVTGNFNNASLQEVLDSLGKQLGFRYKIKENSVVIKN